MRANTSTIFLYPPIAEVYKNESNEEYRKKELKNVIDSCTEGIKVKCKDDEGNAELHCIKAKVHVDLGKINVPYYS